MAYFSLVQHSLVWLHFYSIIQYKCRFCCFLGVYFVVYTENSCDSLLGMHYYTYEPLTFILTALAQRGVPQGARTGSNRGPALRQAGELTTLVRYIYISGAMVTNRPSE